MERLQKVIANYGYASRRGAEELIKQGKVSINKEVVKELGTKVSNDDIIEIDGVQISKDKDFEYYLLNKPRGVISSVSDDKKRKTVIDIIKTDTRIYPVGRLDYDTTGLLILTNDGELTNLLTHPSSNVDKVYIAKIRGIMNGESINKLKNGAMIDGYKTSKARVKVKKVDRKLQASIIEITIHEGKNHQIKKMFESVGYEVIKLKRERYAFLTLASLKVGEYRHLTVKEVKKLYSICNN